MSRYDDGPVEAVPVEDIPNLEKLLQVERQNSSDLSDHLSHRMSIRTDLQRASRIIDERLKLMAEVDSSYNNMLDLNQTAKESVRY